MAAPRKTKAQILRERAQKVRNVATWAEKAQRRTLSQHEETLFFIASELIEAMADALEG